MEKGGLAARLKTAKRAVESLPDASPSAGSTTPPVTPTPPAEGLPLVPPEGSDGPASSPPASSLPAPFVPPPEAPPEPLPFVRPDPSPVEPVSTRPQAPCSVASPASLDVWFWDEMRLGLHGQVRRIWAPIGEKVEQRLPIVYTWSYLVLAVNPVRGEVRSTWVANLKGPTLAPVLTEWFGNAPEVVVVWDGAPGHRNHTVQTTGVRTIRLPPYSPKLDPAERVFRAIRPEVEGLVYANRAEKQALVDDWLRTFAADMKRVRAMTAWSWLLEQIQAAS